MALTRVNDVYFDPARVIAAWPVDNGNFRFSVDHGDRAKEFEIETDEAHGWTLDSFVVYVNEAAG